MSKRSSLTLNEQAFGSCPKRPPHYVLDFRKRGDLWFETINIISWGAPFAARKFIELVIADDEWCYEMDANGREDDVDVLTSSGLRIGRNATVGPYEYSHPGERRYVGMWTMRDIMEHDYSLAEMAWAIPEPYATQARNLRRMGHTPMDAFRGKVASVERKRGTPRASRNGLITIQAIAEEFGMTPRDARGILRKAKLPKPSCGWAWAAADVQPIRDLMEKNK